MFVDAQLFPRLAVGCIDAVYAVLSLEGTACDSAQRSGKHFFLPLLLLQVLEL